MLDAEGGWWEELSRLMAAELCGGALN